MGTRKYLKSYAGFKLNCSYPAIIAQYDEKDIIFKLKDGIKAESSISSLGIFGGCEVEDLYNFGDRLRIKIIRISTDGKITAVPMDTPADIFIREHPVGSFVTGTIVKVQEGGMLIKLAEYVYCLSEHHQGLEEGKAILVRLTRFDKNSKEININRHYGCAGAHR